MCNAISCETQPRWLARGGFTPRNRPSSRAAPRHRARRAGPSDGCAARRGRSAAAPRGMGERDIGWDVDHETTGELDSSRRGKRDHVEPRPANRGAAGRGCARAVAQQHRTIAGAGERDRESDRVPRTADAGGQQATSGALEAIGGARDRDPRRGAASSPRATAWAISCSMSRRSHSSPPASTNSGQPMSATASMTSSRASSVVSSWCALRPASA